MRSSQKTYFIELHPGNRVGGFATTPTTSRPQSVVVRTPPPWSTNFQKKKGLSPPPPPLLCCSCPLLSSPPPFPIPPSPSGLVQSVVYVLHPDRIVVCFRRERSKEKEGLLLLCHGCQMAKFDPFLSLDCARVEGVGRGARGLKGQTHTI